MNVIDSSVLLTVLNQEKGIEKATSLLANAVMSSVNVAETASILMARHQVPKDKITLIINQLISSIISFDEEQALIAAELEIINREQKLGLSLADRACIALGIFMHAPIYTADQIWEKLNDTGLKVKIRKIR